MFTGIIEELGSVRAIDRREGGARLEIAAQRIGVKVHGSLGRAIGRGIGQAAKRGDGAHDGDLAAAARTHRLDQWLDGVQHAGGIHPTDGIDAASGIVPPGQGAAVVATWLRAVGIMGPVLHGLSPCRSPYHRFCAH